MALGTITVLDGNGSPILVQVLQPSPFTWAHVIVDGAAGSNVAQVTAAGALKIDGSGVVQPVSFPGGVTVSGSVSIVQGANTAQVSAAGALKVDNSGTTQPISGAVTANIGTAGPLALESGGNLAGILGIFVAPGTALGANKELMVAGSVTTAAPTYANGQISPLSLSLTGALRVDGSAVTQPISGAVTATLAGGGLVGITAGGNTAAVKAASTAPVAADPSLVVTISPNSPAITIGSVSISQGGNTAAVKAASTAPVATDPALVVAISPNSQNPNGQATMANSSPVVFASNQSSLPSIAGGNQYFTVAASVTNIAIHGAGAGATGDYLEQILCVVTTPANSQVMLGDGVTPAIVILPNNVAGGIGTYPIPLGWKSTAGAWKITTASGVTCIASGILT